MDLSSDRILNNNNNNNNNIKSASSESLAVETIETTVLGSVTSCGLAEIRQRFSRTSFPPYLYSFDIHTTTAHSSYKVRWEGYGGGSLQLLLQNLPEGTKQNNLKPQES